MSFVIAMLIVLCVICGSLLFGLVLLAPNPNITHRKKNISAGCCFIVFILGIVILATMFNAPTETIKTEYDACIIEKMTNNTVEYIKHDDKKFIYFNDDYTYRVEQANDNYSNVIVEETSYYIKHWLYDLEYTKMSYVVYLDKEAWDKYQYNGVVIDNTQEVSNEAFD